MPPSVQHIDTALALETLSKLRADKERMHFAREHSDAMRKSFRKFVPAAWPSVEPSHPFKPAWHVDAIATHLQAVAEGQIQNLLINVPPGSAKSLLCSVMFPAWKWTFHPEWRSTFASYDSGLSTRDSVRCRDLLESVWYRETFQPQWKFATDQNEKTYYVNSQKGFRVSTSVTGRGTGWRSDTILCLHAGTRISTDQGELPIDRIVDERLAVLVRSFDHASGRDRWQSIEAYESSPGRPSVRVALSNGERVDCTADHPFFVLGVGYVEALKLRHGAKIISEVQLPFLRQRGSQEAGLRQASNTRSLLRRALPWGMAEEKRNRYEKIPMCCLRERGLPATQARVSRKAPILQSTVFQHGELRERQPGVQWGASTDSLRNVQTAVHGRPGQSVGAILQREVSRRGDARIQQPALYRSADHSVSRMRNHVQVQEPQADRQAKFLRQEVRRSGPPQANEGNGKSKLFPRPRGRRISSGIQEDRPANTKAGQPRLPNVRKAARGYGASSARSPHRLQQVQQRSFQSGVPLSRMSCGSTRDSGTPGAGPAITVVSVERIPTPARVFNIRVAEDHNYFANGILLHNCDDPINVSDQASDAVLERCVIWWTNTMHNRLISMQTGSRIIIMQRVSDRDLSGHVLRTGGWEHLMIPMEYDPTRSRVTSIGWHDPRSRRDELMCPEIFPQVVVDDTKRTLGKSGYAGQYQQAPAPDGGGILKSHKWNYWQPPGAGLPPVKVKMLDGSFQERTAVDLPDSFDLELQAWDFAFKDLKTSDYVAGAEIGVRGADRFIRDMIRGKMDLPASLSAVREMSGRYPRAHLKLIEDKANGPAVIQSLKHEIAGMVEVNPEGGKIARASAITPELESGNWYLPHPMIAPWVGDPANPTASGFLAESVMFPFGANDDMVDCISMASARIHQEQVGGIFGVSEQAIRVSPFDLKDIAKWPKAYGFHVDWKDIAAVWIARQPETGQHYLWAEYCVPVSDPTQHAGEIKKYGDIQGYFVADSGRRELRDGYAIVRKYEALGLHVETIREHIDASIIDLSEALRSGKLKVFGNLGRFFDQYRMFRRDQRGKIPAMGSGVIMATLVAWGARERIHLPPEKKPDAGPVRGRTGWMAS